MIYILQIIYKINSSLAHVQTIYRTDIVALVEKCCVPLAEHSLR